MKIEQEQIEKMARSMCGYCSTDGKCAVSKNGREPDICANVDTEHCLYKEYAERLIESGYGKVSEYEAEIKKLKEETSNIRKDTAEEFATRICEMLWNLEVDKDGNRFSYGDLTSENVLYVAKQFGVDIDDRLCKENNIATSHLERIIEQNIKIERLNADYAKLQEQFAQYQMASDKEIAAQAKQVQIDVLNKVKERAVGLAAIETYHICNLIDELIKEVQNAENKG